MTAPALHPSRALADLLAREIAAAGELHAQLQAEAARLAPADHASLADVTQRKQGLIESLQDLQTHQARLLAEAGHGPDAGGLEAFIDAQSQPDRASLREQWQRLRVLLRACRDQNLVNGSIIGINLRHCQRAIALLCGQPPVEPLYDPSGNAAAAPPSRRSIKA